LEAKSPVGLGGEIDPVPDKTSLDLGLSLSYTNRFAWGDKNFC